MILQVFIEALLSTAVFHQRFSFFTVCLVKYLHEVLPWWAPKRKSLKFRYPDENLLENSFPTLFLTAEAQLAHRLSAAASLFLGTLEIHVEFYETVLQLSSRLRFYYRLPVALRANLQIFHKMYCSAKQFQLILAPMSRYLILKYLLNISRVDGSYVTG